MLIDAPIGSHVVILEVEEGYPRVVPGDSMPIYQVRHPAELDDPVNLAVEEKRLAVESLDGARPPAEDVSALGVTARGLNVPAGLELDGRAQGRVTGNSPQRLYGGM